MADDTGGTVSAPGDPDTESDDGGALDLLDLPLPTLFARGAAIHRAAQEGTISQVRTSGRLLAVAVCPHSWRAAVATCFLTELPFFSSAPGPLGGRGGHPAPGDGGRAPAGPVFPQRGGGRRGHRGTEVLAVASSPRSSAQQPRVHPPADTLRLTLPTRCGLRGRCW